MDEFISSYFLIGLLGLELSYKFHKVKKTKPRGILPLLRIYSFYPEFMLATETFYLFRNDVSTLLC